MRDCAAVIRLSCRRKVEEVLGRARVQIEGCVCERDDLKIFRSVTKVADEAV